MKSTLPLKNFSAIIFIFASCVNEYQSEPFVSRSSITPIKLVKGNHRNRSALHKREELQIGSVGKISRVVPSKRLIKQSPKNISKSESASHVPWTDKLVANHHEKVEKVLPKRNKEKQLSSTTTSKRPLVLSANSWDYLNSVVTDDELRKVISGLPEDVVNNATNITRQDPVAGQNYLFNSILDQLSSLKFPRSRMLEEEPEKKVNNGVRYSAKHKPVLNVMPSSQLDKIGGKQNMTKKEIDQRVVSGHITNRDNKISSKYSSSLEKPGMEEDGDADNKKSTTPTIMDVIAAPDKRDPYITTPFSPLISSDYHTGFVPVFPINYSSTTEYSLLNNLTDGKAKLPSSRKARGPPKEGDYLLPPITSSIGPETVNKGYQTIPESTTPGQKEVWYSHKQTPEDTFFPNSDGYLVPPEESSLEFLTDLALLNIPNGSSENQNPSSLLDDSKSSSSVIKGLMKENGNGGSGAITHARSNGNTRFPPNSKKTSHNAHRGHLQTAATDHDVIHYNKNYNEDYSKNGGGRRGRNGYRLDDDGKQYFSSSFKSHEVPPYQEINGKLDDDIVSYGAYNEIDHYHHDSFPNKHEISPYHGSGNVYKGDLSRPQDSYNGNYPIRDNGQTSGLDGDYGRRPEKPKQSSPGWGNNQHHGHGNHEPSKDFFDLAKDYFKNSDLTTTQKWFDMSIGVLAFLAFGGYIIMLLYQVFTVGSGTQLGMLVGRSFRGAGEVFDTFFSKGPIGQAYMDELETIVKRAMANVKRIWTTNSIGKWETPKVKGEVDVNKK